MRLHLDAQEVRPTDTGPSSVSASHGVSSRSTITGNEAPSAEKDTVAISATSSAIARLAGEHDSKITRLAQAVRTGAYQISSDTLSSAIVSRSIR